MNLNHTNFYKLINKKIKSSKIIRVVALIRYMVFVNLNLCHWVCFIFASLYTDPGNPRLDADPLQAILSLPPIPTPL